MRTLLHSQKKWYQLERWQAKDSSNHHRYGPAARNAIGNAIEVIEAIDTLKGKGPSDFKEVVFALGAQMLLFAGRADSCEDAVKLMQDSIDSGAALDKMAEFVRAQGGDASYVYDTSKFPKPAYSIEVKAECSGYVHRILAENIGIACMTLGGGRETKDSAIDLSVGIYLKKKNGDAVTAGDTLAVIYANDRGKMTQAAEKVLHAYEISDEPKEMQPVVREYIYE